MVLQKYRIYAIIYSIIYSFYYTWPFLQILSVDGVLHINGTKNLQITLVPISSKPIIMNQYCP